MAVNGQDIGLIFGMAGGGTLQGATGSHIKGQLSELIENLNSDAQVKQRKIKLSLDIAGTKKNFAEGLKQITDGLSSQKQFKIQVKNIDASSAIKKLRTDIQSVLDTLSIKNGMAISIPSAGGSIVGDAGAAVLDEAKEKAAQYAAQLTTIKQISSSMNKSYKSILDGAIDDVSSEKLRAITEEYTRLNLEIEKFKVNKNDPRSQEWINTIEAETAALKRNIQELLNKGSAEVSQEANTANLISGTIEYERAMKKLNDTLKQAETSHNNWTKAKNGKSSVAYDNIADEITHLKTLKAELMSGSITQEKFNAEVAGATSRLSGYYKEITTAGEATRSFSDRLGGLAAKFSTWFSLTRIIMAAFRAIKQMVTNVIELDSAMTQLQIVTGATDAKMTTFLKNATGLAKELGQSISDVLKSIETFSRLGYNLDDSSTLAKYTAILANVAAVDTQEATTGVTSIIKGFNMDVSNSEHVADVLIEVGQKYAVSAAELMEAFEKSGAALNATNTSFEKSVGLIAAANASVQNASTVGTALKTISARIRGSKSDLEELGEDTSELADGFSKYAKELKALTGFDIMVDGTTNQFKDIYDILQGIANVWDKLSDTQQARVAEILGGTRQLQVISSILGNWTDAAGAYQSAMESAGTAAEANAIYMDSIEGKIGVFKATFQELSETLINSEFVKQFVGLGTEILNVLNGVAKLIDAIGGLNTVLAVTVGIVATVKLNSIIALFTTTLPALFTKATTAIAGFLSIFGRVPTVIKSFTSNTALAVPGTSKLSSALKGLGISASAAQLAIGALIVVITAAIVVYQRFKQKREEERQAAIDSAESASSLSSEISDLISKYAELSEAVKTDEAAKDSLLSTEKELINKLGVEKSKVQELTDEYGNLSDAIKKVSIDELQKLERDIRGGYNEYENDLLKAGKKSWGTDGSIILSGSKTDPMFGKTSSATRREQTEAYRALKAMEEAGLIQSGSYSSYTDSDTDKKYSQGFSLVLGIDADLETAEGVLEVYDELGTMLDTMADANATNNFVYDAIYSKYNSISVAADNYKNSIKDLNANLAEQYVLQGLMGREIPTTQDGFDEYRNSVIDAASASGSFIGGTKEIASAIDDVLSKQVQFANFYPDDNQNDGFFSAQTKDINDLSSAISKLKSEFALLQSAMEDMASGHGLSAETIASLADADANYLDYLYEENGVLKLNIAAWESRARAATEGDVSAINGEIRALEKRNQVLNETLQDINDRISKSGSTGVSAIPQITAIQNELEDNAKKIEKNILLLEKYNAMLAGMNWTETFARFDPYITGMEDIAKIQNTLADGFTISAKEARAFADVYPQLLDQAVVSANGQVQLNEDVVNSFLKGKEAEMRAALQAEIDVLEAKRSVVAKQIECIEDQLTAVQTGDQEEVKSANEAAAAKMSVQQAVLTACEQAGIDEETANQLALAAMIGDWDTFSTLAENAINGLDDESAKSFNSVMSNYAIMAQNMVDNTNQTIGAFNQMGTALENALNGVTTKTYTAHIKAGFVEGEGKRAVEGVLAEMFEAAKSDYGTGGTAFDDRITEWQKELQNATSNYLEHGVDTSALDEQLKLLRAQDDSYKQQITLLKSAMNTKMKEFRAGVGDVSGNKSSKSEKEVEAYIADIDRLYKKREALARQELSNSKLSDKISNTDDLRERIKLQSQYVQGLKNEQARLHDIAGAMNEDGTFDYATARAEIQENLETLKNVYGITATYNPETNELLFDDLTQINRQIVDMKDGMTANDFQEAINEKTKAAEALVETVMEQVDETENWSQAWWDAQYAIRETNLGIIEDLKAIVEETSAAVDEIQGVFDTLKKAADEYDSSFDGQNGFISVDTFQEIMALGPQYLKYLTDENGMLVINKQAINDVTKARTEQLAVETAMSYLQRIRMALQDGAVESLDQLIDAQSQYSGTLWDTVYAILELAKAEGLNDQQYAAAKHNIDGIRSLFTGINYQFDEYADGLNEAKTLTDKILQWTMDMLKKRVQDEIDDLEELKTKYGELIQARKDALDMAKEEDDYQDTVLEKTKRLAELQGQIDLLALDDSRSAQAKRQALMEEMAEVQKELDETQRDHSIEQQKASLDQMQKDYEDEKDSEIKVLEDSISSYQKIYDKAIDYINQHWDTLKDELIEWNYEVGDTIEDEIAGNWEKAIALMDKYKLSYAELVAMRNDEEYGFHGLDGGSGGGSSGGSGPGGGVTVSNSGSWQASDAEVKRVKVQAVTSVVNEMRKLGKQWSAVSDSDTRASLHRQAVEKTDYIRDKYGVDTWFDGSSGKWFIKHDDIFPENDGKWLYEVYHTGGIVGGGSIRENEQLALLQKGEPVISNGQKQTLFGLIDFMGMMRDKLAKADFTGVDLVTASRSRQMAELMAHAPTGGGVNIHFGDVTIYGGNEETVRKHQEISRAQANEVLKYLKIKP